MDKPGIFHRGASSNRTFRSYHVFSAMRKKKIQLCLIVSMDEHEIDSE